MYTHSSLIDVNVTRHFATSCKTCWGENSRRAVVPNRLICLFISLNKIIVQMKTLYMCFHVQLDSLQSVYSIKLV